MTYFTANGRALATRVSLRAAGIPFEDVMIKDYKDLAAIRGPHGYNEHVPLGQLPTLTVGGVTHVQSQSLARWAAKKGGALGSALCTRGCARLELTQVLGGGALAC